MTPVEKIAKYVDDRAAILNARLKNPNCINREEVTARLAEIDAVRARLAVIVVLDERSSHV